MDEILSSKPEGVDEVTLWTGGPASQFKNKFVMAATKQPFERHGVKPYLELQCYKSQQKVCGWDRRSTETLCYR